MTTIDEILRWSKTLRAWQSDAARRILTRESLTSNDEEQLLVLVKAEFGLPNSSIELLQAAPLAAEHLAQTPNSATHSVILRQICKPTNVNAIAENQTLAFGHSGLTAVYGDNGTG